MRLLAGCTVHTKKAFNIRFRRYCRPTPPPVNDFPGWVAPSMTEKPALFASDGITTLLRLPHHRDDCRILAALRRTGSAGQQNANTSPLNADTAQPHGGHLHPSTNPPERLPDTTGQCKRRIRFDCAKIGILCAAVSDSQSCHPTSRQSNTLDASCTPVGQKRRPRRATNESNINECC